MNFNQLRFVREAVRRDFNLTTAAEALHTSQPGVSKAILEFEEELGFPIFVRQGKRLTSLTEPGRAILPAIERILLEAENLKRIGLDFSAQETGDLTIATTHTSSSRQRVIVAGRRTSTARAIAGAGSIPAMWFA